MLHTKGNYVRVRCNHLPPAAVLGLFLFQSDLPGDRWCGWLAAGGRSQVVLLSAWWISFDSAFWQRAVCWLQREVEFIRNFAGSGAFIHVTKTAAAVKQRLQGTLWLTPHITWSKKGTTVQWQNTVEIYQVFHRHSNSSVFHQRQCWFFSVTLFTSNKLN